MSVNFLLEAGIDKKRLILDPGFGFGKNFEQNIELHQNFEIINKIGLPIMVGTSRKSFLGKINLNKSITVDKRNIIAATNIIKRYLKKESIIIYESTVYPGFCEEICLPILNKSNLVYNKDLFNE